MRWRRHPDRPGGERRATGQNLAYIELGQREGAELLCGATRLERATEGYFMAPAVFAGTRNDMRLNRRRCSRPSPA
jgi:alpha-ketoglutaric semialdehyde dehydrogenase